MLLGSSSTNNNPSTRTMTENHRDETQSQATGIKATYRFNGKIVEEMNFPSGREARIGIPEGLEPTKPPAGSYSYSGMHDQGPLPPPREGGVVAQLVACVQDARAANDTFLTSVLQKTQEPGVKRPKTKE